MTIRCSTTVKPLPTRGPLHRLPPPPGQQPSCVVDRTAPTDSSSSHVRASATADRASSRQAGLHRHRARHVPSQPRPPSAAPPHAKPASTTAGRTSSRRAGLQPLIQPLQRRPDAVVCHACPSQSPSPVPPLSHRRPLPSSTPRPHPHPVSSFAVRLLPRLHLLSPATVWLTTATADHDVASRCRICHRRQQLPRHPPASHSRANIDNNNF